MNIVPNDPINWTHETYLPALIELRTNACLGNWSPLLERKSTLTQLALNCCHVETQVSTIFQFFYKIQYNDMSFFLYIGSHNPP